MFTKILFSVLIVTNLNASWCATLHDQQQQRRLDRAVARGDYSLVPSLQLTQADIAVSSRSGVSGSATLSSLAGSTTLSFGGGVTFRSSFYDASPTSMATMAAQGINPSAIPASANPALVLHNAAQASIAQHLATPPARSAAFTNFLNSTALAAICGGAEENPVPEAATASSSLRVSQQPSNSTSCPSAPDFSARENFLRALHTTPKATAGDALRVLSHTAIHRTSVQSRFNDQMDRHVRTSLEDAARRRGRTLSPPSRSMVEDTAARWFTRSNAASNTIDIMTTPNYILQAATFMGGAPGLVAVGVQSTLEVAQGTRSLADAVLETALAAGGAMSKTLQTAHVAHRLVTNPALPTQQPALPAPKQGFTATTPLALPAPTTKTSNISTAIPVPKILPKAWEAEDVGRFREERVNQAPYNPRAMESLLKSQYGRDTVASSTLPGMSMPNVKMAGKEISLATGERVVFDQRGYPIFDPYVKFETRLESKVMKMSENTHKSVASRQLSAAIDSGSIPSTLFSEIQLEAIRMGKPQIPGLTWHHHQEIGKIQLLPRDVHTSVKHAGGMNNLLGE